MTRHLFLAGACLLATGCAYPNSTVEQGAAISRFTISDAPLGATILVDGRPVGTRSANAVDFFPVEAGAHTVEERVGDRTILKKSFSVDLGATVDVRNTQ